MAYTSETCWEKSIEKALDRIADDPLFMSSGRRIQDTTNLLIFCELLGFVDSDRWVFDHVRDEISRVEYYRCKRYIEPHLKDWCAYNVPVALTYVYWSVPYLQGSSMQEAYLDIIESE